MITYSLFVAVAAAQQQPTSEEVALLTQASACHLSNAMSQQIDILKKAISDNNWTASNSETIEKIRTRIANPAFICDATLGLVGSATASSTLTSNAAANGVGGVGFFYARDNLRLQTSINVTSQTVVTGASEVDFGRQLALLPSTDGVLDVSIKYTPVLFGTGDHAGGFFGFNADVRMHVLSLHKETVTVTTGTPADVTREQVDALGSTVAGHLVLGGAFLLPAEKESDTVDMRVQLDAGIRYTVVAVASAAQEDDLGILYDSGTGQAVAQFLSMDTRFSVRVKGFEPYVAVSGTWAVGGSHAPLGGLTRTPTLIAGISGQAPLFQRTLSARGAPTPTRALEIVEPDPSTTPDVTKRTPTSPLP